MSRQTERLFSRSQHDRVVLRFLLTPSWFSGLVAIVASGAVVIASIISSHYNGSSLQKLFELHAKTSSSTDISRTYQALGNNFSANTIISDIPLFIFWAGVGLVIYSFANNIIGSLRNVADLKDELNYVNADRSELVRAALEHFAIRAVVLVGWLLFMRYTSHVILPYVSALARVGFDSAQPLKMVGYISGATALLALVLHAHTILFRLVLLKPRVFWQSAYD